VCLLVQCDQGFSDCDNDPLNGCEPLDPFFPDVDGDGFGAAGSAPSMACTAPPGHTADNNDCYDGNPQAYPGQGAFHGNHRGDGSFDFNCDGNEELESDSLSSGYVLCSMGQCSTSIGWKDSAPACGETGKWIGTCNPGSCTAIVEDKTQGCR
jgi:hypothetical protein